jgi:co-chaperonin GroES (HSP10)
MLNMADIDVKQIKPIAAWVLIRIEHGPTKSKGGLIIPEAEKKRSPLGTVVAFGPEVTDLKAGDLTYFDLYEGKRVDEFHILTKREFIYMIVDKEDGGNDNV